MDKDAMQELIAAKNAEIEALRKTLQAVDDWLNDMNPNIDDEERTVGLVQRTLTGA